MYIMLLLKKELYDLSGHPQDGNVAVGWEAGENAQVDTGTHDWVGWKSETRTFFNKYRI